MEATGGTSMTDPDPVFRAAREMNWQQVALNGGPPCFFREEDGRFCGRAERWGGHESSTLLALDHRFTSLYDLLREQRREGARGMRETVERWIVDRDPAAWTPQELALAVRAMPDEPEPK